MNTSYLEKCYKEYIEYKNFLIEQSKKQVDAKTEIATVLKDIEDEDVITDLFFEKQSKIFLFQQDFLEQQRRLFFTVEALKNQIEIPEEIKKEVSNLTFNQIYYIKDGEEEVLSQEALDFTKNQIKEQLKLGVEKFKNLYV